MKKYYILSLLFSFVSVLAQTNLKKADALFRNYSYVDAAKAYEECLEKIKKPSVQTLKNANQPSQREYAADQLSKIRGVSMNQAVIALATAIKEDPAPLVRAACIRSLTRMKINTIEVLEVINEPGLRYCSTCSKTFFLISKFSTTTSITQS